MTKLHDLLDFYIREAWIKDDDGNVNASPALLIDKGRRARAFQHAEPKREMTKEAAHAMILLNLASLTDALRDLATVANMPASEARTMKIGSLCVTLQTVEYSLRELTEIPPAAKEKKS